MDARRIIAAKRDGRALDDAQIEAMITSWLKSSINEPPDMDRKPEPGEMAGKLSLLATPGEHESRAVAL